jgi:hypothetical protein
MKYKIWSMATLILFFASCVQPTHRYEVEFELMIPMGTAVESVSIHGQDYPLSWEKEMPLTRKAGDSVYTVKVPFQTGYLYTEYKYKLNGEYELKEQENRRIVFQEDKLSYTIRDTLNKR